MTDAATVMQRCDVLAACTDEPGSITRPFASDAMRRAQLTGNVDADREAIRQSLLKTDMTTVFGKLKFGNWAGPLGDPYTNQNIYSPDHSVLAQWLDGKLQNVWPKSNAETSYVFPDNTVKR